MAITTERQGQRVYFGGDTFAAKDRIKSLGGHWDGDRRAWWVGAKKAAEAETLAAELSGGVPAAAKLAGLQPTTPALVVADKLEEDGHAAEAEAIRQAAHAATAPKTEDVSDCRAYAQVEYKGRRYYVIAETRDQVRCRLTTLDGLTPFWADCQACSLVRTYEGRQQWDGRRYSGRTVTVYQTIGDLRDFRDSQRQGERAGTPQCAACGRRSDELVRDLEDGLAKCRSCCDIEPT